MSALVGRTFYIRTSVLSTAFDPATETDHGSLEVVSPADPATTLTAAGLSPADYALVEVIGVSTVARAVPSMTTATTETYNTAALTPSSA